MIIKGYLIGNLKKIIFYINVFIFLEIFEYLILLVIYFLLKFFVLDIVKIVRGWIIGRIYKNLCKVFNEDKRDRGWS